MNIEYLSDGCPECPLIRIYGTENSPLLELAKNLNNLSSGSETGSVKLHKLPGFTGILGCSLIICLGDEDQGIVPSGGYLEFEWHLKHESVEIVAELALALADKSMSGCHQWLCGVEARFGLPKSDIGLVISRDARGQW